MTYCPTCLADNAYHAVTYADYPPELLSFWAQSGIPVQQAPQHNPLCSRLFAGEGPRIISPSPAMTYYLTSEKQRMTLQATSGLDVREHVWYINNTYLARSKAGGKLFLPMTDGHHTLACLDDKGRISEVHITVRMLNPGNLISENRN
jgi:penicillin-binding protein 1C